MHSFVGDYSHVLDIAFSPNGKRIASVALHDKACDDAPFVRSLTLIERAADDDRNFVKKGVNWALRAIGRRNRTLRVRAMALSKKLAASKKSMTSTSAASRSVAKLAS